ncbi:hypothetical protein J2Z83_001245 [Virgibacillus natechei]|uniref:Uncharacterized protein n=1 Tax=Virgibacillus natechei TaxID=1216297 RepID=A0ABS4IDY3_9BACI|nr:hypothetical protein [Virgibacillus natechei]MBP1969142.1 hypothetical protein [Virgibacillus natechei]UZD14403.1 hypothetical protein OLD84_07850 [Virgibacillus natechei]
MYYVHHPAYCPACYYNTYWPIRQYPPADPELFLQSANETKKLMNDANVILDKLAESKEFDLKIMEAAQASDQEEVERLIYSLDISSEVDITYNPDNLKLEFRSSVSEDDPACCRLLIALRWR